MADETDKTRDSSNEDREPLEVYKDDISKDADIMWEQRREAEMDMAFINVNGGPWIDFLTQVYGENRTKLVFDRVSPRVNRFVAERNLNRQGVNYKPDDDRTSDNDAKLLNGIYRADYRHGSGKKAISNMVSEVATCGYGAFKLATKFEDEGDPENESQRIEWRPIYNAYNTVFWDRAAQDIDKADARWVTELTEYTTDSFEEAFHGFEPVSAYTPDTDLVFSDFSSFSGLGKDIIYVGTRYEVVIKTETFFVYSDLSTGEIESHNEKDHEEIKNQLRADPNKKKIRERNKKVRSVEKTVFSGQDILKETKRIAGEHLPIVPAYGYRSYVGGVEWYKGLVRPLKDPSRLENMQVSQLAESSASAGQDIPIVTTEQIEGHEDDWADLTNKPFLRLNGSTDEQGNPIKTAPIDYLKPPQLDGATAALLQIVPGFMREVTGVMAVESLDPDASGKAIRERKKIENLDTQPMQQNIDDSIERSGVVYQSMSSQIRGREQIVRTIGIDGTEGREQLLKSALSEETGAPIVTNDLRNKKFNVYSDIGPQYETLREEEVELSKGMIEALKDIPGTEAYTKFLVLNMLDKTEGTGLDPLKKLIKRDMLLGGFREPETEEDKQLLAQAQQQSQEPDPQQQAIEALANQANAEAVKFEADAREQDTSSIVNIADAKKKQAETAKIISETEQGAVKTFADLRQQAFDNVQSQAKALPF